MPRDWSKFSPPELERRRASSVEALMELRREEFSRWYQEKCDRMYWKRGPCCAGCDHWQSDGGMTGQCAAAGIMSGSDVLHSMGIVFCSYTPPPGMPFTRAKYHCGKFEDKFDWSALSQEYQNRVGVRNPEPT